MPVSFIQNASIAAAAGISTSKLGAGAVLQVVQATFTGTQVIGTGGVNANWTDITNLSVTITPTSSTSKMLLIAYISNQLGDLDRLAFFKFTGGNTASSLGNAAGSRTRTTAFYATNNSGSAAASVASFSYLDSPATASAITYKVQACANFNTGNGISINYYFVNDVDAAYIPRGAS